MKEEKIIIGSKGNYQIIIKLIDELYINKKGKLCIKELQVKGFFEIIDFDNYTYIEIYPML